MCAGRPQEQAALYDAQDSDDPKAAIVDLILQVRITHSRRHVMCSSDAHECPQDAASSDPQAALRLELQALRLGGLCQRAAEAGVGDDELCDAQVRSNDHSSATVEAVYRL